MPLFSKLSCFLNILEAVGTQYSCLPAMQESFALQIECRYATSIASSYVDSDW